MQPLVEKYNVANDITLAVPCSIGIVGEVWTTPQSGRAAKIG